MSKTKVTQKQHEANELAAIIKNGKRLYLDFPNFLVPHVYSGLIRITTPQGERFNKDFIAEARKD